MRINRMISTELQEWFYVSSVGWSLHKDHAI